MSQDREIPAIRPVVKICAEFNINIFLRYSLVTSTKGMHKRRKVYIYSGKYQHYMEEADALGDRVAIMKDGKVAVQIRAPPFTLFEQE